MTARELAGVIGGIAPVVSEQISQSHAPILKQLAQVTELYALAMSRIAVLEKHIATMPDVIQGPPGPQGPIGATGEKGDPGRDGQDVSLADVQQLVDKAVAFVPADIRKAVEAELAQWPKPKDGRDGIDGRDGKDISPDDVAELVTVAVTKAVSAIPVPKDGIGLTGALIDRSGDLLVTLSDGTVKNVGAVVGRDADPVMVERVIREEVAKIPTPKDGRDGIDGKDGLGFDDFSLVCDPGVGYRLRLAQGERVKDFPLAIPHDAGIYQKGTKYVPGSCVTWANSYWLATADTDEVPGNGATAWRMVARGIQGKTGPAGKDGKDGARGPQGPPGATRY